MYIVDPMTFYWLSVLDALRVVFLVVSVLGGAVSVVMPIIYCVDGSLWDEDETKRFFKMFAFVLPTFFVSVLCVVFIPSKQTMIEMLVAKFATTENAEWTVDALKSAVDYIVEAMKSVK